MANTTNKLIINQTIANYFRNLHDVEVNQKYAGVRALPYSFHLDMVAEQAKLFGNLTNMSDNALTFALYGHDAIEDARLTYNDLLTKAKDLIHSEVFDQMAVDAIYYCTECRGKNRDERHSAEYYEGLCNRPNAIYVKLCDIIANVKFSLLENSSMFNKYKSEWVTFRTYLFKHVPNDLLEIYSPMITYLNDLLSIIIPNK